MTDTGIEIKQLEPKHEVPKEEFLHTLKPEDRDNISQLIKGFEAAMTDRDLNGALMVVGGIMNKLQPRKDIDILLIRQRREKDPQKLPFETQLDWATMDFRRFSNIVTSITVSANLRISSRIEPSIDEEFENPNILKSDGTITLISNSGRGLPMELIRDTTGNVEQQISKQKGRFCVIAEV
ncbi:MAG: hypothetical protein HYT08_00770 [Candidatus Levybacteria bacterium]|nr:hypothetical protein [Candidatus Levybacteria bacterium]